MDIILRNRKVVLTFILSFFGAISMVNSKGITPPVKYNTYSIKYLFDKINTNNPKNSSLFLVPTRSGKVMLNADMYIKTGGYKNMNGSASSKNIGIDKSWCEKNGSLRVEVKPNYKLVERLKSIGRLKSSDVEKYKKILLYFIVTKDGKKYRLYINDPYPAKVANVGGTLYSAASKIIAKWDV